MFKVLTTSLLLGSAVTMFAQLPPPIAPEQIVYRHWPEQFVQWIGPELPYTMIELYVDPAGGATPVYDAVLTERATGKRVHYTNQQQMLDIDKRSGADAYLTTMQLDRPANAATGATYLLRFVDHAGQPVSWQFIQGSDISERGGGSSPAGLAPPVLMYRERSAVAGEGSALKIGNAVSVADVWTEISQPPYFVAYHGAISENVDIAVFAGSEQQWTTTSAPQTLAVGAEWKLKAQDGLGCTLRVQALAGDHATILDVDDHLPRQNNHHRSRLDKRRVDHRQDALRCRGGGCQPGFNDLVCPGHECHRDRIEIRGHRWTQDADSQRYGAWRPRAKARGMGVQGSPMAARQDGMGRQRGREPKTGGSRNGVQLIRMFSAKAPGRQVTAGGRSVCGTLLSCLHRAM